MKRQLIYFATENWKGGDLNIRLSGLAAPQSFFFLYIHQNLPSFRFSYCFDSKPQSFLQLKS